MKFERPESPSFRYGSMVEPKTSAFSDGINEFFFKFPFIRYVVQKLYQTAQVQEMSKFPSLAREVMTTLEPRPLWLYRITYKRLNSAQIQIHFRD